MRPFSILCTSLLLIVVVPPDTITALVLRTVPASIVKEPLSVTAPCVLAPAAIVFLLVKVSFTLTCPFLADVICPVLVNSFVSKPKSPPEAIVFVFCIEFALTTRLVSD